MADDLQNLVRKRGTIKGAVTRFATFVSKVEDSQQAELQARLEGQQNLFNQFEEVQEKIEELNQEDDNEAVRNDFETIYYKNIALANSILKRINTSGAQSVSSHDIAHVAKNSGINEGNANICGIMENAVRLPTINLPEFDGKYENWYRFRDSFHALVHGNVHLSDIQKYMYLNLSLKGPATEVIQSLEVSAHNYTTALDLLKERFENKRIIVNTHMRALYDLECVSKANSNSLRQLLDGFLKHYRSLKALELPVEHWDVPMVYVLSSKIDNNTRGTWERAACIGSDIPKLEDLITFLKGHCQMLEAMSHASSDFKITEKYAKPKVLTNVATSSSCTNCKGSHLIYQCKNLLDKTPEQRLQCVRNWRGCTNCLRPNHTSQQCNSTRNCFKCNKRHHTLLHISENKRPETIIASHAVNKSCHILLSTAIIYIKDRYNRAIEARALIDSGSDSNYITSKLFKETGLKYQNTRPTLIAGINGTMSEVSKQTTATIKSAHSNYQTILTFLIVERITEQIPIVALNAEHLRIPKDIKLADQSFNTPGDIDLLIGAEIFYDLVENGKITLGRNQPVLRESKLGWLVTGRLGSMDKNKSYCHLAIANDLDLNDKLERFWKIDECPEDIIYTTDEMRCENDFTKNTTRDETGRYVVALPFNDHKDNLGTNLQDALTRYTKLERRFERDNNLKCHYVKFMSEYESMGHMQRIGSLKTMTNNQLDKKYYIPHHPVLKMSSSTTKLRVVFDASAQTDTGLSLNNTLLVGPIVQSQLLEILIRFRRHNIALVADIEKMFRQVKIIDEHRDFQRILWRKNQDEEIGIYHLCTVTYGTASATFLTTRCIKDIAEQHANEYPTASRTIIEDMYVDDLITGSDDVNCAIRLHTEVTRILRNAGFNLRKWGSNSKEVLAKCSTASSKTEQHLIKESGDNRTLGIIWMSDDDTLRFVYDECQGERVVTKRNVLSTISKVFDPLGLISPIIIDAKCLVQQLWLLKLGWDESVPDNINRMWSRITVQLHSLNEVAIPRQVLLHSPITIQLCGFSDSSEKAYAAAIYIRSIDESNNVRVALLCSKTRVAPVKVVSLPRLELSGALLLAKLASSVLQTYNTPIAKKYYFTDSSIALNWLNSEPTKWKSFVANRVAKIQNLTDIRDWYHVPGKENPADIATRGVEASKLTDSMWFTGPRFLEEDPDNWPVNTNRNINETLELRTRKVNLMTLTDVGLFKYSSLKTLKNVTAYILRFARNCQVPCERRNLSSLTADETDNAMMVLLRVAQHNCCSPDIAELRRSAQVHKKSKLRCLAPFLDNLGLLRVGGRLKHAPINYGQKHQIILPKHHPLTRLLIKYVHNRHFHAGAQATLSALREQYWPIDGKNTVKNVIKSCLVCFKYNPKRVQIQMADLPKARVTPARPFLYTSLDMAGPFETKETKFRNKRTIKSYVCIFVCFVTKAVHLEVVSDLSCATFLNCLKRFTSRRGLPKQLYSDNGKAFVAANKELRDASRAMIEYLKSQNINNYLTEFSISWKFMPPRAPHFGGLHEAAVKSMKIHLKKVTSNHCLTIECFSTLLCQIESILNSRPLYPLSDDPNDLTVLTPGHFLIGAPMTATPQKDVTSIQFNRLKHYQQLQQMCQHFWQRWSKEYLCNLQTRAKWLSDGNSKQPGVNDIVLVKEDNITLPQHWPLGRILQLHPGPDGKNRVATILLRGKEMVRSIVQLCPLPKEDLEISSHFNAGEYVGAG